MTVPGDLHGYQKDETLLNQWTEMSDDVETICESAESDNPGAPAYTTTDVNFREKDSMSGKIIRVIPSDEEVWITGNLDKDWTKVNYKEKDGYVSSDYLELPGLKEEEESGNAYTDTEKESSKEDGYPEEEEEIPFQGFNQCVVYDENGH